MEEGKKFAKITYISAHNRSSLKLYHLSSLLTFSHLFLIHITERHLILRKLNTDIEGSLEIGFIKAGKRSPRIPTFKLSTEHEMILAYMRNRGRGSNDGLVARSVETSHLVIHHPLIFQRNKRSMLARFGDMWDFLREFQGNALLERIIRNIWCINSCYKVLSACMCIIYLFLEEQFKSDFDRGNLRPEGPCSDSETSASWTLISIAFKVISLVGSLISTWILTVPWNVNPPPSSSS